MFHVKQRRLVGLLALAVLIVGLFSACVSNESRGWGAPVPVDDETQVVSSRKGKLDGIDARPDAAPAWTGTLSTPLTDVESLLPGISISPTDTPFQGDLLFIESEIVRVRSLTINGAERELHLDRGFGGTTASAHPAGATIEAFRRAWRFPDDWRIRSGDARNLDGVYGTPVAGTEGMMYVGDYGGWVYGFSPSSVNLDASNDDNQPGTAIVNVGDPVIGGLALDEEAGLLYATAGQRLVAISTERMNAAIAAGGGEVAPETTFHFEAADEIWGAPTVEDGIVYVTSLDGNLYALDGATGNVVWTYDGAQGLTTTPVIVGDLILVAGFDDAVFAVNKSDGTLAWDFAVGNWVLATPTVEGDTAYFGDFDGLIHAVNVQSGEGQWSLPLDRGEIRGAVAVSGDFVVAGTDDGWLTAVDRTTQQRVWETDIQSGILADLVTAGDEVLIAPQGCTTLSGSEVKTYYRAVDAETGTLRRVEGIC
jgi:outer membrane protein assembly factor BamB